jgi:hypothetical protein
MNRPISDDGNVELRHDGSLHDLGGRRERDVLSSAEVKVVAGVSGGNRWILASLVAFRDALVLAVLAASGRALLPGFPHYEYDPLAGDAYAYYFAAREILATWQREALVLFPVAALAVAAVVLAARRLSTASVVTVGAWAVGITAGAAVGLMRNTGSPTIGWPLVLSVPLLPYRALGLPLDPDVAFVFGLVISLALIALVVVETYALARAVTANERIAVAAAALFGLWPLLVLVLGGHRGTLNGTWQTEIGVSVNVEPLSTALVLGALVLVLRARVRDVDAALAGGLLGLAVAVRLSNALIVLCVVAALAIRRREAAVWAAAAAAAFAPAVLAYWPKGYAALEPPTFPEHPFALRYAQHAWTGSLLWRPVVLLVLVPLAILGTVRVTRWTAALLWSCVLTTALFFTFYEETPEHPRFLFVVLPIVLVLWAAGAAEAVTAARDAAAARLRTPAPSRRGAVGTPHRRRRR